LSYLDDIADAIKREVPADAMPSGDTQPLFRMYAVLARAKGEAVDASDVHDAWAAWMAAIDPEHASLLPYADLTPETRESDRAFVDAVRRVVRSRLRGAPN
jgi:hypothetical protein